MDATFTASHERVLILDFGSQYTHLIARRLRECNVYCELHPYDLPLATIKSFAPKGIILSGGPSSVYAPSAPHVAPGLLELRIPVLGICYGLQEMAHALGGAVVPGTKKEFGRADISARANNPLLDGLPESFPVWMSHGDKISALPTGFVALGSTDNTKFAAVGDEARRLYGVQFHPEVTHTAHGTALLRNFVRGVCGCTGDWSMAGFVPRAVAAIRDMVGETGVVIGAVSGGVDSTVAAVLMQKAVGKRFHAVLVDNGVLRGGELGAGSGWRLL